MRWQSAGAFWPQEGGSWSTICGSESPEGVPMPFRGELAKISFRFDLHEVKL